MSTRDAVAVLAAAVLLAGLLGRHPGQPATAAATPLDNPHGTRPGLAPITSADDRSAARDLIGGLRVRGMGPKTGYSRARYGENWADTATDLPYAGNGCRTRDDLLARDGHDLSYRRGSSCDVVALSLDDPYTGRTIAWRKRRADDIQVDHVVPLSYSWRMGATRWPAAKRLRFANDPLNLLPVDGDTNEAKGGSGPAAWLPPQRRVRCAYAVRFAQVALKYGMAVTRADKATMLRVCR
ncbi:MULTISPECIES: HNH endonuclease family protein [unclassified Nonomuraea]|uniref:HNH endonuclease family protein n=1 Tax=Nonomuraea sp. NPDC003804 TaxID=3154547 RepID=UPI0033A57E9B